MKFIKSRKSKKVIALSAIVLLFSTIIAYVVYDRFVEEKNVIASIEPWNFTPTAIIDIYVNGKWGGAVDGHRGGGSSICCAIIPRVWREGLVVNIKWQKTEDEKWYTTVAPVPKYTKPAALQILFLADDKIQVYIDSHWPCSPPHQMARKAELCKE